MRFVTCAVLLTFAAGIAEACSAFIPFDEYAGHELGISDAGTDGALADATTETDAAASCKDADLETDPENCGACGRRCGACAAKRCPTEIIADGTSNITAVDVGNRDLDGGSEAIYFVRSSGTLARVDADGGRYEEALAQTTAAPLAYGVSNGIVSSKTDAIDLFSRDRFLDAGVTHIVPSRKKLGPLLYEAGNVLWSDDDGMFWAGIKADASVSQLSDASAIAITSSSGVSYWTDDNGLVLRTSARIPDVFAPVLKADRPGVTGIAVNPKHIYLAQRSQGLIVYDFDGTTAKLARQIALDDPELVVIDDAHVYVYNAGPAAGHRQLLRYELDGTGSLVLADTLTAVRALAVDATHVYFTDQTKLARIVK